MPSRLIRITGEDARLVDRLRRPLGRALGDRHAAYDVDIDSIGRVGEVLVSITGSRGHVPLCLRPDELDEGYVCWVVRDTVSRFGL